MGEWIIKFINANGMRPIIALVTILCAFWITINSSSICVIKDESAKSERENPICSRYFEMAALVLGGLIGLSEPGRPKKEPDEPEDGEGNQKTGSAGGEPATPDSSGE